MMRVCNPLFTVTSIRQPGTDSTSFIICVVVGGGGDGGGATVCTQDWFFPNPTLKPLDLLCWKLSDFLFMFPIKHKDSHHI
jgi:hypothetical protein